MVSVDFQKMGHDSEDELEIGVSNSGVSGIQREFQCTECTCSYARAEHLERHLRTHTGVKYLCDHCGKGFTRSDVLKRHKKVHDRDESANDTLNSRKQAALERSTKACRACASSKVKCLNDGDGPCKRCEDLQRECIYDEIPTRKQTKRQRRSSADSAVDSERSSSRVPIAVQGPAPPAVGTNGDISVSSPADHNHRWTSNSSPSTGNYHLFPHMTSEARQSRPDRPSLLQQQQNLQLYSNGNGDNNQYDGSRQFVSAELLAAQALTGYSEKSHDVSFNLPIPIHLSASEEMKTNLDERNGGGDIMDLGAVQNNSHHGGGMGHGEDLDQALSDGLGALLDVPLSSFISDWDEGLTHLGQTPGISLDQYQDPGLILDSNPAMFWSSFTSPPQFQSVVPIGLELPSADYGENVTTDSIFHAGPQGPDTPASESSSHLRLAKQRERARLLPSSAGIATRHQSLEPAEIEEGGQEQGGPEGQWPMHWDPASKDSAVKLEHPLEDAPAEQLLREHRALVPRFDEDARLTILETLRYTQLTDHEYHSLYKTMSRIKLSTFDLLCQLYFRYFHQNCPFIHVPTFSPKKTVGFLLVAIIGIGSLHSGLAGCTQFGRVLLEVARRSVEHLTNRDNRIARSLPMIQAMSLWSTVKWVGSPRTIELAEVFRGVFTTSLRRLRAFEESPLPVLPVLASLKEKWYAWTLWEERRRIGLATFLLEIEMTTLMNLPPTIALCDLKNSLACSEDLWNAPTAEAWNNLAATRLSRYQIGVNDIIRIITLSHNLPSPNIPEGVLVTPFNCHVLFKGLHSMVHVMSNLRAFGNDEIVRDTALSLRRSLRRLAGGPHEFSVKLAGHGNSLGNGNGIGDQARRENHTVYDESDFQASIVTYHMAMVGSRIRMEELEIVAGRGTKLDSIQARRKLENWMSEYPKEARSVALHSAQVIRVIKQYPKHGTYESYSLFSAALCLYIFSRSDACRVRALASDDSPRIYLDQNQVELDPTRWVEFGGATMVENVGDLAAPTAPKRLLHVCSQTLAHNGVVWKIGSLLANVLSGMGTRETIHP